MTLIMHILETYPPGFLSCLLRAGAGEMAPNYDESEIPSPGARPWPGEMGSNERRESRQGLGPVAVTSGLQKLSHLQPALCIARVELSM